MRRPSLWLVLVCACVTSLTCKAGLLSQATIGAQPQQFLTNGEVSGCGLTFTAVQKGTSPKDVLWGFNGSILFANLETGLVKGRAFKVNASDILTGRAGPSSAQVQKTEMVWLKAAGEAATTLFPGQSVRNSDDPGYIMYLSPLDPVVAVLSAIADKRQVQIGFKPSALNFDVVFFGSVEMEEADRLAFSGCIGELVANLRKELSAEDPKNDLRK